MESTVIKSQHCNFFIYEGQSSSTSMKEQASVYVVIAGNACTACTHQRESVLRWMPRTRPIARIPVPSG